jgi:hypothetical protein
MIGADMISRLLVTLLLGWPALAQTQAIDARTAAGCGAADISFDVKTDPSQHTLLPPESGKAMVYVATDQGETPALQVGNPTTRVGLDGSWVGANHGTS